MRLGLISDIHGNLEALEVCLDELKKRGIDQLAVVGDVVGYGADPAACLSRVREAHPLIVAGNHDWAVSGKIDVSSFNRVALDAVRWTAEQLSPADHAYLDSLPLLHATQDLLLVHASPLRPEEWDYLVDKDDARSAVGSTKHQICFVGHSHVPFFYGVSEIRERFSRDAGSYELEPGWTYLVNVGSVGQPRDGNIHASCALLDIEACSLQLIRVAYPVGRAMAKIQSEPGLPEFLAQRLAWGY